MAARFPPGKAARISRALRHWNKKVIHSILISSDGGYDDEDEASDVGISMATGLDGELEKQVYYNTCAEMSSTRFASRDLAAALNKWRSDPAPLVEQFEVSV